MKFHALPLQGAFLIEIDPIEDERGLFARTWCREEWIAHGLNSKLEQCSLTLSKKKGTLRGMHFQTTPHEEAKLVRCTRGSIYDVIIDMRPTSLTFRRWYAATLSADNHQMLYVPEGFAHGLQTLEDDTEVFYQMSESYHPECATGVRWDDPAFSIEWPEDERIISAKDLAYPDFKE